MRAMQRISCLESDDSLPALLGEQRARFARREDELTVFRMFGLRQDAHHAAEQMRAWIALGHAAAGMIETFRAVDAADIMGLVPRKYVADFQRAYYLVLRIHQGDCLARLQRLRLSFFHRKRQRDGPGVLLAVVEDYFLIKNAVQRLAVHRPGKRAESAVAQTIQRRKIGVA